MNKVQHGGPGNPEIGDRADALLDASLADTFPASDPIALVWPHKPSNLATGRTAPVQNSDVEPRRTPRVHRGGGSTC
jgi:hypothetical protein